MKSPFLAGLDPQFFLSIPPGTGALPKVVLLCAFLVLFHDHVHDGRQGFSRGAKMCKNALFTGVEPQKMENFMEKSQNSFDSNLLCHLFCHPCF